MCNLFLFFVLCFVFRCLFVCFFLCHQRVGLRFSVIPPQFERTLRPASYGRNKFTSLWFSLLFLHQGAWGHRGPVIPAAFFVIKATTRKVLSRIARTLDSIIAKMKIFQCKYSEAEMIRGRSSKICSLFGLYITLIGSSCDNCFCFYSNAVVVIVIQNIKRE